MQQRCGLDFDREADRYQGRDTIAALVEPWCAARGFAEVEAVFNRHRVCWGQYRTTTDLLANDNRVSLTNPIWERIETTGVGSHYAAGTPIRAQGESRRAMTPAPLLGQHTDEVLLDVLGLDSGAVGRLHDTGIVAGAEGDPTVAGER